MITLASLLVIAQLAHGAGGTAPPASGDWLERPALPLLRVELLEARKDAALFKTERIGLSKSYLAPSNAAHKEPAYERDDQAVQAAMAFLKEHFDTSQYELAASRIDHIPAYRIPDVPGYTIIVIDAVYHGLILHGRGAVVYLTGKTISSASIRLGAVTQIAGSEKPLLSRERAVSIWQDGVQKKFGVKNVTPGSISLQYVYSDENPIPSTDNAYILGPNWIIEFPNGSGALLVDGRNGQLWRND